MMIFRRWIVGLLVLTTLLGACSAVPAVQERAEPVKEAVELAQVERFRRFEVEVEDVEGAAGVFRTPGGELVEVGGFDDGDVWKVRFSPTEVGVYAYQMVDERGVPLLEGGFEAVEGESRGFVRVDERGGFPGLIFDDGSPFLLLGENRINIYDPSWNWQQMGAADYVAYMAENGMTTLRFFIFSDCENEEAEDRVQPGCLEPEVGKFDVEVAREIDSIMEAAEREGIYVIIVAFAVGFSPPPDTWKSWEDNPYSVKVGGPAKTRFEFFEDDMVRDQAFGRLRYIVDRWGYSPNLLAIDLLNEPEWDGEISERIWTPWARDMARRLQGIDPNEHLITVGSVGLHWNIEGDEHAWWGSEENDLVQWHRYGPEIYEVHNLARELSFRTRESAVHKKPVFCGEFGWGADPPPYDHTAVGIWSLVFSGAGAVAHSAPPFNLDSDAFMTPERGAHFRALRSFMEPLLKVGPLFSGGMEEFAESGALLWTLRGDEVVGLWVMGPKEGYGEPVEGLVVEVELEAGPWLVEWVDDRRGEVMEVVEVESVGGVVELEVPGFVRHVGARVFFKERGRPRPLN